MGFWREHFRELLLCLMALAFAGIAMWTLKHGDTGAGEAFRWASGAVTTLLGALIMLMQGNKAAGDKTPDSPPPAPEVKP